MSYVVRANGLAGFGALVTELGGNPAGILEEVGLDTSLEQTPDVFVPYWRMYRALELAAESLHCPDFGLRLGSRQTIRILGPIALVVENERFLGAAIRCIAHYVHLHDTAFRLTLNPKMGSSEWLCSFDPRRHQKTSVIQHLELALALGCKTFALLSGEAWTPVEIWVAHPAQSPLDVYARYFPCPIRFSMPTSGIVMRESDLQLPVNAGDPTLAQAGHDYLISHFGKGKTSLSGRVRALIRPLLEADRCSREAVAQRLATHPRTLHRHLQREGTSFEEIKDSVRREWAAELLRVDALSATQIAMMLGYANEPAFNRSCHRWFGASPRHLR